MIECEESCRSSSCFVFRMANPHGKFDNLVNRKSDTEDEVTDEMNNKEQKENGYNLCLKWVIKPCV